MEEFWCNFYIEFLVIGNYIKLGLDNNCRFLDYMDKKFIIMEVWCDKNCFVWNGEKKVKVVLSIILSFWNKNI